MLDVRLDVRPGVRPDIRPDVGAARVSSAAPKKKAFDRGGPVWPPRSNVTNDRLRGGSGGALPPQPKTRGSGGQRPPAKNEKYSNKKKDSFRGSCLFQSTIGPAVRPSGRPAVRLDGHSVASDKAALKKKRFFPATSFSKVAHFFPRSGSPPHPEPFSRVSSR